MKTDIDNKGIITLIQCTSKYTTKTTLLLLLQILSPQSTHHQAVGAIVKAFIAGEVICIVVNQFMATKFLCIRVQNNLIFSTDTHTNLITENTVTVEMCWNIYLLSTIISVSERILYTLQKVFM